MSQLQVVKGKKAIAYDFNGGAEGSGNFAFSGSGSRQKAHAKSGQWAYALNNETLTLTGAALPNAAHIVSCWCYGDDPSALLVGSASATPRLVARHGGYKRFAALFTAAQCNGQTLRKITTTGQTWVDDVCTVAGSDWDDLSEAFDGDTPGCRWWKGPAYNGLSVRPVDVLDNGQIADVDDGVTVWCKMHVGAASLMPLEVIRQEAAVGSTALYLDTKLKERAIRLELFVKVSGAKSVAEAQEMWHKRLTRLTRLFPVRRQFALRLITPSRTQQYRVVLAGMEQSQVTATTGNAHGTVVVMLTALDPRPQELTENFVSLSMNRSLTLSYYTVRDAANAGQWTGVGSGPGATVRRIYVAPDHTEYVCTLAASGTAYVKRRNADDSWTTICSLTGSITAGPIAYHCVLSTDGTKLYVVGDFTTVNGTAGFGGLATITLSNLSAANMGTGCSGGHAERCLLSPAGDHLLIVGSFTSISSVSANRVAKRNLSSGTWSAYASGLSGPAYALAVGPNGDLLVGGNFGASSGFAAPSAPSASSARVTSPTVGVLQAGATHRYKITYLTAVGETDASPAGSVVITAGGPSGNDNAANVTFTANGTGARLWRNEVTGTYPVTTSGTEYFLLKEFGAGVNSYQDLGLDALDKSQTPPTLNTSGQRTTNSAWWDDSVAAWKNLGLTGFNGIVRDLDLAANGIELVAVGDFDTADGYSAPRIAWFGGSVWLPCGPGLTGGSVYGCRILDNGRVVAVGAHTASGGMTAGAQMAYWTGGIRGAWLPADIAWPGGATLYDVDKNYDDVLVGHTSTGSATPAALTTVTVQGTAGSQPIWEIEGPCTLRCLINHRTGYGLYFSESAVIAASEIWRFNSADLVKTLTSTSHAGSLVSRILVGSDRGTFGLETDDNDLLMLATGTSGASASNLRDRTTNLSGDGSETDE